jgi:putative hydrolase of the HAD superfamily
MPTFSVSTIAFDADDTLWHNETVFRLTEERFAALLADFADPSHLGERLLAAERRNLAHYGYGIKGFTLSMIETAIEITESRAPASLISEILGFAKEMVAHPVETLPGARETLECLKDRHRLLMITKGDLFDQERKLAQSGLGDLFDAVEIVSEKDVATYAKLFQRHGDGPERSMMVGNSLKSDILPALQAGCWAVYVPHELIWELERAEEPTRTARYTRLETLRQLPELLRLKACGQT